MSNQYNEYFNRLYNSLQEEKIKDSVFEFFVVYSRFEYALKNAGYLKSAKEGSNTEADWFRFAKDNAEKFAKRLNAEGTLTKEEPKKLKAAVAYLENKPPRKEIVKGKKPSLKKINNDELTSAKSSRERIRYLVDYVKIVRNNLFHGEKFSDISSEGYTRNFERDFHLLDSSLVILGEFLKLDPKVEDCFAKGM